MTETVYHTTPDAVQELRRPWPSLAGEIDGLSPELEREFRFGQRVTFFNGSYRMGGNVKGGSSSIWYPAIERDHQAYLAWRDRDGIPIVEDRVAYEDLERLLGRAGTKLTGGGPAGSSPYQERYGSVYRLAVEALGILPPEHLSAGEFATLQLGGWGPDSAKASAYHGRTVMMYDFALKGARRAFVGLFLHELGHAHEKRLQGDQRRSLREALTALVEGDALIGVEYLLDGEARKAYQKTSFTEFVAEAYMIYVSHGPILRENAHPAWSTIYSVFREGFGGIEYA